MKGYKHLSDNEYRVFEEHIRRNNIDICYEVRWKHKDMYIKVLNDSKVDISKILLDIHQEMLYNATQ